MPPVTQALLFANVAVFVLEMSGARPFDRAGKGWTLSLLMSPGF